jgi:hypothetical protein
LKFIRILDFVCRLVKGRAAPTRSPRGVHRGSRWADLRLTSACDDDARQWCLMMPATMAAAGDCEHTCSQRSQPASPWPTAATRPRSFVPAAAGRAPLSLALAVRQCLRTGTGARARPAASMIRLGMADRAATVRVPPSLNAATTIEEAALVTVPRLSRPRRCALKAPPAHPRSSPSNQRNALS